eukprot:gene25982-11668_t
MDSDQIIPMPSKEKSGASVTSVHIDVTDAKDVPGVLGDGMPSEDRSSEEPSIANQRRSRVDGRVNNPRGKTASKVLKVLEKFDIDDNDTLDVPEERNMRRLKIIIFSLIAFTFVLLAAMTGLTYAIVATLKDTEVQNNVVLVTRGGATIQTGSTDFAVNRDGLMMNRGFSEDRGLNANADIESLANVLRVSTYSGDSQGINSLMDINDLMELNYLHINSPDGNGQLALRVNGVARKAMPQSLYGTVVDIITSSGTIVLDGELLFFEQSLDNLFSESGFDTGVAYTANPLPGGRRKLLDDSTKVTGRYTRRVNYVTPPPVPNADIAKDWQIQAETKAEAQKATKLLAALRATNAAESEYATMWHDYKRVYGKVYSTMGEDLSSFRTWIKNMLRVLTVNADDTLPFWTSPNAFFDQDYNSVVNTILMKNSTPNVTDIMERHPLSERHRRQLLANVAAVIPKAVNWAAANKTTAVVDQAAANKTTPVVNQGACGSCWAFAAAAAIESALLIGVPLINASEVDISEQQFVDCVNYLSDPYFMSMGCLGGDPIEPIIYTFKFNATKESILPYVSRYTAMENPCDTIRLQATKPGEVTKTSVDALYVWPMNDEQALMKAVSEQPVATYFMADHTFLDYSGGIYVPTTCTTYTNHNFLIVGYNITAPIPYWIIKNSWGKLWGEKGYARIAMTGNGYGPCGMYSFNVYPGLTFEATPPLRLNGVISAVVNETMVGIVVNETKVGIVVNDTEADIVDPYEGYGGYEEVVESPPPPEKNKGRKKSPPPPA